MDSLGDRMKGYEDVPKSRLIPKLPVLMRLDGKAFHTLTRGMSKPWDERFQYCMWATAKYLCQQVQGCQLAYVQSDEISLLLIDYYSRDTQPWFDYQVMKMCSVAAGMASAAFNNLVRYNFTEFVPTLLSVFDCRVWNTPIHEVTNYFIWRQQDAVRNSIQGLGQANFSQKQLHGKSCANIQEMLFQEKGINWNDCLTWQKRGLCLTKAGGGWAMDHNIPTFTQDRNYIERYLVMPEDY